MGSILTYPNRARTSWVPVRESEPRTRGSEDISYVKTLCLIVGLLVAFSLGSGPLNAEGEEHRSERSLISRVEPEYPDTLQRLYIGGVVRLELTVTPKGNVESVILLGGNPILGQSAMAAAKKWRYAPASSRTVVEVRISFDPHR
jgi:TonB family protein